MRNFAKKILVLLFISISLSTVTAIAYAEDTAPSTPQFVPTYIPKPSTLPGPEISKQQDLGTRQLLVGTILPRFAIGLIGMTGGFALLMIVIGGVRYLTAYGNDEAAGKGKNQIIYGIVGMIVALLAYTIVTAIVNIRLDNNQTGAPIQGVDTAPTVPSTQPNNTIPGVNTAPEPSSQAS